MKKLLPIVLRTALPVMAAGVCLSSCTSQTIEKRDGVQDKIWVHRVNSAEKLNVVEGQYAGVEVDVVFEEGYFDVNHPPAESIGLSLADFFNAAERKDELGFWIDYKNLSPENARVSANYLKQVTERQRIPNTNVIVESKHPELLEYFSQHGFRVSYYIPQGLYNMEKPAERQVLKNINKRLREHGRYLDFISSNYKDYKILKQNFPGIEKLFWHSGGRGGLTKADEEQMIKAIVNDNTVAVLLEGHKTRFDR